MEYITSRKNEKILHIKRLGADAEYRRISSEFVCDGTKMLDEAVKWGAEIRCVLCTESAVLPLLPNSTKVFCVPEEVLRFASQLKTPQKILFSCSIPKKNAAEEQHVIVLENIQDPGNVGTIIRTADALGAEVVLVGSCADQFSPKTVRASMGAVFRMNARETDISGLKKLIGDIPLYGAVLGEGCLDIKEVDLRHAAVAIGSEGRGLSPELLGICDARVIIPISPRCESLNAAVASAIFMWEMKKSYGN